MSQFGNAIRVIVSPLIDIVTLDTNPDLEGVTALAFTSVNGVSAFASKTARRDFACFCVGDNMFLHAATITFVLAVIIPSVAVTVTTTTRVVTILITTIITIIAALITGCVAITITGPNLPTGTNVHNLLQNPPAQK